MLGKTALTISICISISSAVLPGCSSPDVIQGLGDTEGVRWANGNPDFSPAKNVLLVPINRTESNLTKDFDQDDNCFYAHALNLKRFYEARGAKATLLSVNTPDAFISALERLAAQHKVFDRLVFNSHGGWHGPMFRFGKQIGLDWPEVQLKEREGTDHRLWYLQQVFLAYGASLNRVLSPKGWIWIGSCNASTEGGSLFGSARYTDAMACTSDRMTYGVIGKTACWDVEDRVKKLEDGIKTPNLWRSNPKNLPEQMVCFGDSMPPMPPLLPPPDLMPPPAPDAGPDADAGPASVDVSTPSTPSPDSP